MTVGAYPIVVVDAEGVGVIVDDWEVYDFLDDLFVDNDLVPSSMRDRSGESGTLFEIRFTAPITADQIKGVLGGVAPGRLAEIRALNR